jgi:quercetin dioxygenase-like cupin family protein
MLARPNQSLILMVNADQRIGVESIVGCQDAFKRNIDFDEIIFQFAGTSKVETECGLFDLHPGEILLVPGGIAQRSTGSVDCLRMFGRLHSPVTHFFTEDRQVSETAFEVVRHGGPKWTMPAGAEKGSTGQVLEAMVTWRDESPDDFTYADRDYANLIGRSSALRDEFKSTVHKLRIFDFFTEKTGIRGPSSKLIESDNFFVEAYNTHGEQFAFHRALRSEEFGLQFRGTAVNMSEFDAKLPMVPGDFALVPLGISHSVICDENFLRTVWYSRLPWDFVANPNGHAFDSSFEVRSKVLQAAELV